MNTQMEAVCDICMFSPKCKDERLSCDHSAEFCSTCIDECVSHGIYVCPICRAAMDVPIPVRVEIGDIEINTSSRITSRARPRIQATRTEVYCTNVFLGATFFFMVYNISAAIIIIMLPGKVVLNDVNNVLG